MRVSDALLAALVMALWGFNLVAAKLGMRELPPILLIALRFTVVALVLVWFVRPPWERMGRILGLSVTLGGLHFSLMFTGLARVDASAAAIAIQLQVPFAALLAVWAFGDRLGWRRAAGMLVAFLGIGLIAGTPRVSQSLEGLGLVLAAGFVWAVAAIQIKRLGPINGFALNGWVALFAAPQLFLASLLVERPQWETLARATWMGWGAVLYMAVLVTIVGYGVWYRLLARYDVNQAMPFTLLVPVFGVLSGVLVLGEPLTRQMLIGGLLTLTGVALIVLRRSAASPRSALGARGLQRPAARRQIVD
ncbi:MAG: EamA family transporter [Gammaproteobacteria bacterium]|nr:EamA family transporter [Gammaproteobacteria bacterium]NIR84512.1 EamA family transporter [Gammaproteobacteria bacterium]NIR90415.1 EamA family transporter [Gammaproteobacteria bacterium]NIU05563.1 EamA family transporter [Gammaproteobacteria bacterium]NIV52702.1 EamA family transporter [Gammaproteobacteria bacterium]